MFDIQQKFDLSGKIAVITGASKGIGEAIAYALGKAGAQIVLSSRKQEAVENLAAEFMQKGINAVGIVCNVSKSEENEALIQKVTDYFGGIDILVNNAGTNPTAIPIEQIELKTYDKIMDVNLKGAFYLSQLVHPVFCKRGGGNIINIASVEGITPSPHLGVYAMTKAAMIMMTKSMAKEWGKDNISVNAICPGYIQTRLTESIWSDETQTQEILKHQIIQNIGVPDDIAGLALLLASPAGAYFTGSILTVDGGHTV
jgi:NAD(P)-dependent dehydrogenase (short-subunit alcohol dehydrogenase family)